MSINPASTTDRNDPSATVSNHHKHFIYLLAGLAGAVISPLAQADNLRPVTRQHIENWNQTLQSGNIDDILDLYADTQPMLLQPDGKVAKTAVEIARFWRILLAKGDTKFRFDLIAAHKRDDMIIARLALSHTGLQRHIATAGGHDGMFIYCVIKRQANGQWKTQLQKWN